MHKNFIISLLLVISHVCTFGIPTSSALLFEARTLNNQEPSIAEKDYLSIVEKCYDRLEAKEDSGEVCDAFFAYYIKQCAAFDNLLSYCDVGYLENIYVNPLRDYEFTRYNQQGCIKQNQTFMDSIFCEDYIDIPGEAERRFLKTLTNKSHLIIPSATLYTTDYSSKIFGEVMNNYTYPIEGTHILAGFNYTNGSAVDFDHGYTQDSIIKPGHKSGFWFFFENPLPINTKFTLTSELQRSNVSLPEKLLLTVMNPDNRMSNHTPVGITDVIQTKDESPSNIFNGNKSNATTESRPIINSTQAAINEAQNILTAAADATANATDELMSRADNVLSLASDAASNATETAMQKTMNLLENVSDTSIPNTESEQTLNEEANELINAATKVTIPMPVTGNITNLGNVTATNVEVSAIFYDENHIVVDTNSDYIILEKGILPGQQVPFSLTPFLNSENSDKIVSYVLNVESSEYSMLPSK